MAVTPSLHLSLNLQKKISPIIQSWVICERGSILHFFSTEKEQYVEQIDGRFQSDIHIRSRSELYLSHLIRYLVRETHLQLLQV